MDITLQKPLAIGWEVFSISWQCIFNFFKPFFKTFEKWLDCSLKNLYKEIAMPHPA